jgi:hypothetical protein
MSINIQKSVFLFIFITLMSCTQDDSSDITVNETLDTTFVEKHGGLQVSGNQIINKIGEPVSFAGNSFFWSNDNWAVNDKEEEWSIVVPGASTTGNWTEDDLTDTGKLAKNIILNWPN